MPQIYVNELKPGMVILHPRYRTRCKIEKIIVQRDEAFLHLLHLEGIESGGQVTHRMRQSAIADVEDQGGSDA